MDFFHVSSTERKDGTFEISPNFLVGRSKDLMVRGKAFYAIWDEKEGLWSTDEYDVQRLVDEELSQAAEQSDKCIVKYMRTFGSNSWAQFRRYVQNISDHYHPLDSQLTFANTEVGKDDYVSKRLPYALEPGDISAWDELVGTLYNAEEREKIEWAIGSIVSGSSKKIQKFLVFYGPAGTGKSTILNVVERLFTGYVTSFEAKALGSSNAAFATEVFKNNPLVAIQHDGDLSKIDDNTRLNSIISHEEMTMNEKFKASYSARVNAFLFMGTNQPVKISDAKSGIIRRLIDVHPTGVKIPVKHYNVLMDQINFELGAIAHHCLEVFNRLGAHYYDPYRPLEMMLQTDVFFNFIESMYDVYKSDDMVTLRSAYASYKEFCTTTGIDRPLPQYKVREELRNYFDEFHERYTVGDERLRSVYKGFTANKFKTAIQDDVEYTLVMDKTESVLDQILMNQPAQYANEHGTPERRWEKVNTTLAEIDTSQLHYVKVPENHIVIDFDLKDENGTKSRERNLVAAANFPPTYAEYSQSGQGIHLHYIYTGGEPSRLRSDYSDGIEVKVFRGDSALRRRVSGCNGLQLSHLSSGLPLKEKKMLTQETMKSEKAVRELIERNLHKKIHPGTKPSVDFIKKILDDAFEEGFPYDVSDMKSRIIAFANNSTNQPLQCLRTVQQMRFSSDDTLHQTPGTGLVRPKDDRLVFFDVEVYPNLLVVCWKYQGDDNVVRMVNPDAGMIENLMKLKLVGFNNRRYDNHILYGRFMGYDNTGLFNLSQKIINGNSGAMFGEAYNLSWTDIYDFSSKKQGLKKFQIELGLYHKELSFPWDEEIPEDRWDEVVEYCVNDVVTTEKVFEARKQDYVAREILASLSKLSLNHTTQQHTAKIIFGNDRNHKDEFVYTDLSEMFPGYKYDAGKSTYKGIDPSEGGYVYAEPGYYENVSVLDVASMHPTSIIHLNLFGKYTKRFRDLVEARLAIKRKEYSKVRTLLDGRLSEFIEGNDDSSDALSYALKIVINIVYGLTSAGFDNPFRDNRNVDNIVAKRGALFMIDVKNYVEEMGYTVAHIKTDSIKIPNASPEIIQAIIGFGKTYGYTFEHETTYDKFCLVNDAVYVAREGGKWTTVGAQFAHPYVYKTLFSNEEITFEDFCETKNVTQGSMWLDYDAVEKPMFDAGAMHFVGRTGRFVPVYESCGGGVLYRVKDDKLYAVTGTKGHLWMEAEAAKALGEDLEIDLTYFDRLVDEAKKTIEKFVQYEEMIER